MQTITATNLSALQNRTLLPRDFLSVTVRDIVTDADVVENYWSGTGTVTAPVYNPDTGANENRDFLGVGELIQMDPIARVANLTVQVVTITMNGIRDDIRDLVQGYNARQAKVEIWRGYLDATSRILVDAAEPRFFGFVDTVEWKTSLFEGESSITLTCTSHSQEMTRYNPETRSDTYQRLRNAGDAFYSDTASVGDWEQFWGANKGKLGSDSEAWKNRNTPPEPLR